MPYDINAALLKLEQNLNDLTTARNQVENAVKASNNLQKVVSEYVTAVEVLCVKLKEWDLDLGRREGSLLDEIEQMISQLNSTSDQIISSFKSSVEETTSVFITKTDSEITKLTEQNNKLAERVKELDALRDEIKKATEEIESVKEVLRQISKDLKESQDGQDAVLADIKQKLSEAIGMINGVSNNISEKYNLLANDLHSGFDSIDKKVDNVYAELSNVKSICQDVNPAIEKSRNEIEKSININRWIMIIAFIILVILHFVAN